MPKLTLDDLAKIREKTKRTTEIREGGDYRAKITVHMGTCGIAAGARKIMNAFICKLWKTKKSQTCCLQILVVQAYAAGNLWLQSRSPGKLLLNTLTLQRKKQNRFLKSTFSAETSLKSMPWESEAKKLTIKGAGK